MRLGIGSFAYMWAVGLDGARPAHPMTPQQLLTKAVELGVQVVQLGPNLNVDGWTLPEALLIAEQARSQGITLELGTRGTEPASLRHQMDLARVTGATLLRTMPQTFDGSVPSLDALAKELDDVLPLLAASGVRLALENATIPAKQLRHLLEKINSPFVGITLDTVNSLAIPEGLEELLSQLGHLVLCLHLKDFTVERVWHKAGFVVEGRPAGKGLLDIPALLRTLAEAGSDPNVILELWTPEQSSMQETIALEAEWVQDSIAYLRSCIAA